MWAGKFTRWKRRDVSAQQPGLLKFYGRERRGKVRAGSINLHGASIELSNSDPRLLVLRGADIGKVYLRTTDPDDRQPCAESIQVRPPTDCPVAEFRERRLREVRRT